MRHSRVSLTALLVPLIVAPLTQGCRSSQPAAPTVNNALLAALPPERMAPVTEARTLKSAAADAVAAAELASDRSELERDLAKVQLAIGKEELRRAELLRALAEAGGTPEELRVAEADFRYRKANLDALKKAVPVFSAAEAHTKMLQGLAEATLERQASVVELETARATKELDSTVAAEIDLAAHLDEVDRRALRVQKAEELVERAAVKLEKARAAHAAASGLAEQLAPGR